MKRRAVLQAAVAPLLFTATAWAQGSPGTPDLSQYALGRLPSDLMTAWRTGQGAVGDWRVVRDVSASHGKAIEQASADKTDYRFPLAVYEPLSSRT